MKNRLTVILQKTLFIIIFSGTAGFLFFNSTVAAQERKKTVKDTVANVYSKPDNSASVIDTLKAGDEVLVLQEEKSWNAVKLSDKQLGWIHQSVFEEKETTQENELKQETQPSVEAAPALPLQQAKARLIVPSGRVRSGPSTASAVRYGLKEGEVVTILKEENKWWQVQMHGGETGWAHSRLFKRLPSAAPEPSTLKKPPVAPASPGEAAKIEDSSSSETAAVSRSFFQAVLKVNIGRVRQAPSLKSAILFKLNKNDQVTVIETKGDWYRVLTDDGKSGWSHTSLFTLMSKRELKDIRFAQLPNGKETVTFLLNSFNPPATSASDENSTPKIVCDFLNTGLKKGFKKEIESDGKLIKRIHTAVLSEQPMKIRVVTELDDSIKYSVKQVFYKKKNEYVLTVEPFSESESN